MRGWHINRESKQRNTKKIMTKAKCDMTYESCSEKPQLIKLFFSFFCEKALYFQIQFILSTQLILRTWIPRCILIILTSGVDLFQFHLNKIVVPNEVVTLFSCTSTYELVIYARRLSLRNKDIFGNSSTYFSTILKPLTDIEIKLLRFHAQYYSSPKNRLTPIKTVFHFKQVSL